MKGSGLWIEFPGETLCGINTKQLHLDFLER